MWKPVLADERTVVASRAELSMMGATGRDLTKAVARGELIRIRRDHYASPRISPVLNECVRIGGRLACISALSEHGVFAFDARQTHVHLDPHASRVRHPQRTDRLTTATDRGGARMHWDHLHDARGPREFSVGVMDALFQSVHCQGSWHTLASIDSAVNIGAIRPTDLPRLFDRLPSRLSHLEQLVDGRAESGQETVLRMIVHSLGLDYDLQVEVEGVGRVDMLVEGRLVLEADSRLAHEGWEAGVRDRGRDLASAMLGLSTLRPAYAHTMHHPELVADAILGLVRAC